MEEDLALEDVDAEEEADGLSALELGQSPRQASGRKSRHTVIAVSGSVANQRRLSRQEIVTKQSMITPISVQKELMQYKKSEDFGIDILEDLWRLWSIGYLKVFLLWTTWMVSGTVFYALRNDLGWKKGFYMMVNVGYSVGWGYPRETDNKGLWFSIMNVFVGAMALSYCLRVFAISVMSDSKSWYAVALYERKMQDKTISRWEKIKAMTKNHKKKLINITIFVMWVCVGVFWSTNVFGSWRFVQGLYFSISSLSTGGMYPIPSDASDDCYVIVGMFTAFGVPLMGLAMADLTRMLLKFGSPEKAKEQIRAKVTEEELQMLHKFGMDDGSSGLFTKTEFVILSMMRLRVLTPTAVEEINKRFNTLDIAKTGFLAVDDIVHHTRTRSISHIFRKSNFSGAKRKAKRKNSEELRNIRTTLSHQSS